jgi:hypothetical protein
LGRTVYNDLPHPAATYIGNKYAWRTADGAGNNVEIPEMGKAGTPYSRSVQQSHAIPQNSLPDAGLIFDTLLKREGVSLISIAFAICLIFDCSSWLIPLAFPA